MSRNVINGDENQLIYILSAFRTRWFFSLGFIIQIDGDGVVVLTMCTCVYLM